MLDKTFNFKDIEPRIYAEWEESGAFRAALIIVKQKPGTPELFLFNYIISCMAIFMCDMQVFSWPFAIAAFAMSICFMAIAFLLSLVGCAMPFALSIMA